MWLLVLVHFAGAMQIERMNVVETHWDKEKCIERVNHAVKVGLPVNTNIGCIYVGGMKQL